MQTGQGCTLVRPKYSLTNLRCKQVDKGCDLWQVTDRDQYSYLFFLGTLMSTSGKSKAHDWY